MLLLCSISRCLGNCYTLLSILDKTSCESVLLSIINKLNVTFMVIHVVLMPHVFDCWKKC